jgi:hypothetical protein
MIAPTNEESEEDQGQQGQQGKPLRAKRKRGPNKDKRKQRAFLKAYALCHGNKSKAARLAGVCRNVHYAWMEDPTYKAAFSEVEGEICDGIEEEMYRRAIEGVEEPVFGALGHNSGTGEIGTIRKYSDTMLAMIAKGAMPEKYRERQSIEHSGKIDGNRVILIETEDWYGNNAHNQTTESLAAPTGDLAIAGPQQTGDCRPPDGQDGNGSDGGN